MIKLKIEKGIPIPEGREWGRSALGERVYVPWNDMEVGDSVFAPHELASGLKANASQMGKKFGKTFITRTVPFGVRVWREA